MASCFPLGRLVITAGANSLVRKGAVLAALQRHSHCDWGDLCPEDKRANDEGLALGGRILSSYRDGAGTVFWIITEADRASTCVLLPSDY